MGTAWLVVISLLMMLCFYLNTMLTFPIEEVLEVGGAQVEPLDLVLGCARGGAAVGVVQCSTVQYSTVQYSTIVTCRGRSRGASACSPAPAS